MTLPHYYGSVGYWLRLAAGEPLLSDALYDKRRKEIHRCTIADVNGPLRLTIPIVHPHGISHARWSQVAISRHHQWWHTQRIALESAYGRTPFFEYYIDDLLPFLSPTTPDAYPSILHLNLAIHHLISSILLLPPPPLLPPSAPLPNPSQLPPSASLPNPSQLPPSAPLPYSSQFPSPASLPNPLSRPCGFCPPPAGFLFRVGALATTSPPLPTLLPYWQPRIDTLGFIPDLCILDLIFCLGPEAALYIRRALTPTPTSSL